MEQKTKIKTEDGKQHLVITRTFDLPVELLFRAYVEPDIVEQWMSTKVIKLESERHGGYQFETTDAQGNTHRFSGVIHEFSPHRKITRTFEMEKMPFGVQLEILEFEKLDDDTSRLKILTIFESVAHRDQMLRLPFARGINMAHDRLQDVAGKL